MKKLTVIFSYSSFFLVNVFFWVGVYFFYTYFLGYGSSNTIYVNRFSGYLMPVTICLSYFVILFLIPKYLRKRKYKLFILYGIYTIIISFAAVTLSVFYGLVFSSYLKGVGTEGLTKSLPLIVLSIYFVVIIAVSISLLFYGYQSSLNNEDLKNKVLQTQLQLKEQELKFLKMQIHPHFLFNSLNTIYGFALKKGDEAPDMILKLSNLLDYILYQIEKPTVALEDELNHLEDYIALEKMRFHDTLNVVFERGTVKNDTLIAPMLLIPFVENSFKHGSIIDGCLAITISVSESEGALIFQVKNSVLENKTNPSGIGLENIKKRLEMLYPDAHRLEIIQEDQEFKVKLEIDPSQLKINKNVGES
ncbi:MAG: histidine kinase [Flavobacteriaceae bacterium]